MLSNTKGTYLQKHFINSSTTENSRTNQAEAFEQKPKNKTQGHSIGY